MLSNFDIEEIANHYNINVGIVMNDENIYTQLPIKTTSLICNHQILETALIGWH